MTHTDHNTDESVRDNKAPVQVMKIELSERTLSIIAIVLGTLGVGLAILAVVLSQIAEREARLAQYDAQIMRARLETLGVKTDDH
jgi:hypothetical protein